MDNLGKLPCIFARNCTAGRITRNAAAAFLDANHRMGATKAKFCYALIHRSEIVAVASFAGPRRLHDSPRSFEWVRYASLQGIRVVGGMGKLLAAFRQDKHPSDVMTYVDASLSDGSAYKALGFKEERTVSKSGFTDIKLRLIFPPDTQPTVPNPGGQFQPPAEGTDTDARETR